MSKTNSGLVNYAKAQVGLPYWYGCYGQTASASLYTSKKKQYPSNYTASDFAKQYGKRVHDCVGLIKGYLWSDSATATPKYNSAQDKSASGMYTASTTKGKIATFPKTKGLLVFKGSSASAIHHVGIYDGSGYVYEAKGHAYGVVKSKFDSTWTFWAQCPYCTDDISSVDSTASGSSSSSSTSSSSSSTNSSSSSSATVKTATESAQKYSKSIAGTYKINAKSGLHLRDGAGTKKTSLVILPNNTEVKCYGYYTTVSGIKWLYIQVTYKGTKYTGFSSNSYLKKIS